VACFGSCGLAPVMVIEKDVHGRMNATKVKQVIKEDQQRNWGDGAHPKEVTAKAATTPVDGGQ
jgi:(2Fe-2S) ferredoxin